MLATHQMDQRGIPLPFPSRPELGNRRNRSQLTNQKWNYLLDQRNRHIYTASERLVRIGGADCTNWRYGSYELAVRIGDIPSDIFGSFRKLCTEGSHHRSSNDVIK